MSVLSCVKPFPVFGLVTSCLFASLLEDQRIKVGPKLGT